MAKLLLNAKTDWSFGLEYVYFETLIQSREDPRKHYHTINSGRGRRTAEDGSDTTRIFYLEDIDKGTYEVTVKLLDRRGASIDIAKLLLDLGADVQSSTILIPKNR